MIGWVDAAYQNLSLNPTSIQNSFEVRGITSSDPQKVRKNEFYQLCMEKALADLEEPEKDDKDPFDSLFLKKDKNDQKWNFSCLSFYF